MAWIKKVYLYLVSLISLIILVIAAIMLINMALKAWVFHKADMVYYYPPVACDYSTPQGQKDAAAVPECNDPSKTDRMMAEEKERRSAQRQSDAAHAIAMIIVGAPVFLYHWRLARKET
jgi:hypothetical protein